MRNAMDRLICMCAYNPSSIFPLLSGLTGQSIVGKGNHSVNGVQKLKPRVEQVCRELGLQYATEENAGRIYVNLTGGPADMQPHQPHHAPHHAPHHTPGPAQPHHPHGQEDEFTSFFKKLEKVCCVVM